ncbi:hypothetical protein QBC35DRAFT_168915 [Podospora australis]|uniref:Uncharacterized protein n=1 Tax=Podospora australis TaxID=1536484 RepID=A0AAN6WI21_9PEZI|nr:hypothetical protein QBC35DRAFT_168915 [Podospora australis]
MDAAGMTEEKKLKQAFVLATLISTIAGTFITGINLYDRLIEQRRQKKLDRGQNKKIKELESRLNEAEEDRKRLRESKEKALKGSKKRETDDDDDSSSDGDDRNLRHSLERSGPKIQREYDRFYQSMGQKFAQGDLIAQTQLQSQIIVLQGTVIKLLEEALMTGKPPDLSRLYNTSEFSRDGSIRALQDQYQRFLQAAPIPRRTRPAALLRRTSSTPSLRGEDSRGDNGYSDLGSSSRFSQPPRHNRPSPSRTPYGRKSLMAPEGNGSVVSGGGGRLFCRYAEDLQRSADPIEADLCPACGVLLVGGGDFGGSQSHTPSSSSSWRIEKEVALVPLRDRGRSPSRERSRGGEDEEIATRTFILTPRFAAKCHRADASFACYLCFCHRDRDTLCRTEEALVSHVAGKHNITEYGQDADIKEMSRTLPYR